MENLIEELVLRLEQKKEIDENKINENKNELNEKGILFLAGKIEAFKICIHELKRLINYHKGL
ncbi:MAG: hypothetical protein A2046_09555 [Bacteroidetes bacterium GWA2_30_7]|nr:MAG: hypothetical protein A2046_09555 [Bacteroidetes bacterium GWA2_30_7]